VLALSYGWLTAAHPEPDGTTFAAVLKYLRAEPSARACGLFWDFASLPQKPRTAEQTAGFGRGLKLMGSCYASITGTAVLQLKDIPPRPSAYDGCVSCFNVHASEVALRAEMSKYGTVRSLEVVGETKTAHIVFESHDQAEHCVAGRKGKDIDFAYNAREYEGVGARGWCIFEQGASQIAAAHLAAAEKQTALPLQFAKAQASRAKVIDISGGRVVPFKPVSKPSAMLKATTQAIEAARFTGKGDLFIVQQMLAEFEYTIQSAVGQASIYNAASGLTPDPSVLRKVRAERRAVRRGRLMAGGTAGSAAPEAGEVELVTRECRVKTIDVILPIVDNDEVKGTPLASRLDSTPPARSPRPASRWAARAGAGEPSGLLSSAL